MRFARPLVPVAVAASFLAVTVACSSGGAGDRVESSRPRSERAARSTTSSVADDDGGPSSDPTSTTVDGSPTTSSTRPGDPAPPPAGGETTTSTRAASGGSQSGATTGSTAPSHSHTGTGGGHGATTTTRPRTTTTTRPRATTTTTRPRGTTTTTRPRVTTTTTAVPPQRSYVVDAADPTPPTLSMPLGTDLTLTINSVTDQEFHVHGYDILKAGTHVTFSFTTDLAGTYIVESHTTGKLICRLAIG